MKGTMMAYPLTLVSLFERAGKLFSRSKSSPAGPTIRLTDTPIETGICARVYWQQPFRTPE